MIDIIVVEDSEVVRKGLISLISNEPDMQVVGEAQNGLQVIEMLLKGKTADLILADLNMPVMDGIGLTKNLAITFPLLNVVILTMHVRSEFVIKALKAGAKGYLLKDGDFEEIMTGIRKVYLGEIYVTKNVQRLLDSKIPFRL